MVIPEGYKQTEIGLIPEMWNTILFDKCFKILANNTLSRAELNENNGNIKNIHYGDILVKYGNILNCTDANIPYINASSKKVSLDYLLNGDLIIADTAEDETVGKAVEMANVGNMKIVSGLHTIPCRAICSEMFANGWLGYYINHSVYHDQLLPFITGTKVSAISKSSISGTLILVPPIEEQQHISEALSNVDSMIYSLEKLIEKKKAVKQGTMQELLTGKRRLPGFTEEWYDTTIGEHCLVFDGTHQTPKYTPSGIPFYSVENVTANDFVNTKFISIEEHEELSSKCKIEKGDILMTRIGSIGDCKYVDWDVDANFYVSLALIKCKDTINAQFLSFYSKSLFFKKELEIRSLLTAIPQKINLGPISNIRLRIPFDIKEQSTIASILSDMDNEIESLEQKLKKVRQLKQGMMQQLLTGKIRLA